MMIIITMTPMTMMATNLMKRTHPAFIYTLLSQLCRKLGVSSLDDFSFWILDDLLFWNLDDFILVSRWFFWNLDDFSFWILDDFFGIWMMILDFLCFAIFSCFYVLLSWPPARRGHWGSLGYSQGRSCLKRGLHYLPVCCVNIILYMPMYVHIIQGRNISVVTICPYVVWI